MIYVLLKHNLLVAKSYISLNKGTKKTKYVAKPKIVGVLF